jgi:hypothetical protein
LVVDFLICDITSPQDIVERNQAAAPDQIEAAFVVEVVGGLISIDKGKIERILTELTCQLLKCGGCRSDAKINLPGHTGFLPIGSADGSPLFADVARNKLALRRKGHGDGQCTEAGKDPNFQRAPGGNEFHQPSQKRSLIRTKLHAGVRESFGFSAEPLLDVGFFGRNLRHILFDRVGKERTFCHNARSSGVQELQEFKSYRIGAAIKLSRGFVFFAQTNPLLNSVTPELLQLLPLSSSSLPTGTDTDTSSPPAHHALGPLSTKFSYLEAFCANMEPR